MVNNNFKFFSMFSLILTIFSQVSYAIIYVDSKTPTNNGACPIGKCWDNAYNNLQDALAVTTVDDIWVAAGVYYPDEGVVQVDNDQTETFTLINGVSFYGGFNGTETSLEQRDPDVNLTILSGDITQNDNNFDGNFVAETLADVIGANSYHIITGSAVGTASIFDGFIVTSATADGPSNFDKGAGMYCGNNTNGPSINQVKFVSNYAVNRGSATYGCSQLVTNSSFINNFSEGLSGAVHALGGVYDNVIFSGNIALGTGGALRNNSGFPISIKNTKFIGNTSMFADGGALYLLGDAGLENVLFSGNKSGNGSGAEGGAIFIQGPSNAVLTNVTISGNSAVEDIGGGIVSRSAETLDIRNSIIWNNLDSTGQDTLSSSLLNLNGGTVTITNSFIQGSGGSSNWYFAAGIDGGNNLDENPEFVSSLDPSMAPTNTGDYHLQILSMAIDTGDNSFVTKLKDLNGLQRIRNGFVDRGSYEFFKELMYKDGFE